MTKENAARFMISRVVALIAITAIAAAFAQGTNAAGEIHDAQRLMVAQKYSQARAKVTAVLQTDPGNIDAIFTLATIEQTRILDYESYTIDGRRFLAFADSLLKILEARQPYLTGADSVRCMFYRANILGGIGVVRAKRGSWIDGARIALSAQNLYRQIKRIDPDHLGADLGLGVFDYYLGTSLQRIPFVSGASAERGLQAIERSLNAPFPFNVAAKSSYSWILMDRQQFRRADSLAVSAQRYAPGSTIFLRIRAHAALWGGDYDNAIVFAERLAAASRSRTPVNWSDLMASHYIIASSHDKTGRRNEAHAAAIKALELPIPDAHRNIPHVRDHIRNLTGIRNRNRPR